MKGGRIILIRRFVPYRMYTFVSERRGIAGYVAERRFQKRQKDMLNSYHYSLKNLVKLFFAITKTKKPLSIS